MRTSSASNLDSTATSPGARLSPYINHREHEACARHASVTVVAKRIPYLGTLLERLVKLSFHGSELQAHNLDRLGGQLDYGTSL